MLSISLSTDHAVNKAALTLLPTLYFNTFPPNSQLVETKAANTAVLL